MDETIEELSILVEMMKNKVNTKIIEKRTIDFIKYLEKTNKERENLEASVDMSRNVISIKKRNEILQTQIIDADTTINQLYKQIDELNTEKQELKKLNISLLDEKQNLEKCFEQKKVKMVDKSTGAELFIITQSKEKELKEKIKQLETDIANFDKTINDYDTYFDEFEKYQYRISYPIPKAYTLDEEIQYINMNERKKKFCCFL